MTRKAGTDNHIRVINALDRASNVLEDELLKNPRIYHEYHHATFIGLVKAMRAVSENVKRNVPHRQRGKGVFYVDTDLPFVVEKYCEDPISRATEPFETFFAMGEEEGEVLEERRVKFRTMMAENPPPKKTGFGNHENTFFETLYDRSLVLGMHDWIKTTIPHFQSESDLPIFTTDILHLLKMGTYAEQMMNLETDKTIENLTDDDVPEHLKGKIQDVLAYLHSQYPDNQAFYPKE